MTSVADSSMQTVTSVGGLFWFREPPLIAAIVRVLRVERASSGGMFVTVIEVLASEVRRPATTLAPRSTHELRGPRSGGAFCGWSIEPLAARTVDAAVAEVQSARRGVRIRWRRT
jgi:hypothetical protein